MTATLPILLCLTLTSIGGTMGGDLLVPGWRKVRCDVTVDVTAIPNGMNSTPPVAPIAWIAEVGFSFGESTFQRLEGTQLEIPFHHYGATRLIAMPADAVASFLDQHKSKGGATSRESIALPAGSLSTPRLGGGFVQVPEADATQSMKQWLKVTPSDGNQLLITTVRTEHFDASGRVVEPGSFRFMLVIAVILAVIGAYCLFRFRRRSCCTP